MRYWPRCLVIRYKTKFFSSLLGRGANAKLEEIAAAFGDAHGPRHWDRDRYIDEAGYTNVISIGYWDDPAEFDAWFQSYGSSWTRRSRGDSSFGSFTEVVRPGVERFETLFSSTVPETSRTVLKCHCIM